MRCFSQPSCWKGGLALLLLTALLQLPCTAQPITEDNDLQVASLPPQCIVSGSTTSSCLPSCSVCKNIGSLVGQRECFCCKPGFVKKLARPAQCIRCPIGKYAPRPGIPPCKNCTGGLTTWRTGSVDCNACLPGRVFKWRSVQRPDGSFYQVRSCPVCARGFTSPGGPIMGKPLASIPCTACPKGRTTFGLPRVLCNGCALGHATADCTECPPGTYSTGGNLNITTPICKQCASGTTSGAGAFSCTPVVVSSPSPLPYTSPSPAPVSPSPRPASPSPKPQSPSPAPSVPTCALLNYHCTSGVLKPYVQVPSYVGSDALCCDTCTGFSCGAGVARTNPLLLANVAPSFRICCDACASLAPSCAQLTYTSKSPSPQLDVGTATAELCCVVPPVERAVVGLAVAGTGDQCDPVKNQQLADELYKSLVNGLTPEEAAKITVIVLSCKVVTGRRRLLLNSVIVELGITTRPDLTQAEVVDATKVLIEALNIENKEQLPPNATLSELVAILNEQVSANASAGGNSTAAAEQLLLEVNAAIVSSGLGAVFNNATLETVVQAPSSCLGFPSALGVKWPDACNGAGIGAPCEGTCDSNLGQVMSTCLTTGFWSNVTSQALDICKAAPPPVTKNCIGSPPAVASAIWPDCTNAQSCTATCLGDTKGSPGVPTSYCDTATGNWTDVAGSCVPIRCEDPPTFPLTSAYWPTLCSNNTVGGVCYGICVGTGSLPFVTCTRQGTNTTAVWVLGSGGTCLNTYKAGATCSNTDASTGADFVCGDDYALKAEAANISIASKTPTEAKSLCCDPLYPAGTTCSSFVCGAGYQTKSGVGTVPINGLPINGAVATAACCDELFPVNATCGDINGDVAGAVAFTCGAGYTDKTNNAGVSIFNLTAAAAVPVCCDPAYPAGTTCSIFVCGAGYQAKLNSSGILVNGLAINGTAARTKCCDELFPVNATCGDVDGDGAGAAAFICGADYTNRTNNAGLSIFNLTAAGATTVCCEPLYKAGATCGNINAVAVAQATNYTCTGVGLELKADAASINITGLTVEQAQPQCCKSLASLTLTRADGGSSSLQTNASFTLTALFAVPSGGLSGHNISLVINGTAACVPSAATPSGAGGVVNFTCAADATGEVSFTATAPDLLTGQLTSNVVVVNFVDCKTSPVAPADATITSCPIPAEYGQVCTATCNGNLTSTVAATCRPTWQVTGCCVPATFDLYTVQNYTLGGIARQHSWTTFDSFTDCQSNSVADQEVVDVAYNSTTQRVWRMSNARYVGFSASPFSYEACQVAGEAGSSLWNDWGTNGCNKYSPVHFGANATIAQFAWSVDFRSATGTAQPGLNLCLSAAAKQSSWRVAPVKIVDTGSGGFDLLREEFTGSVNTSGYIVHSASHFTIATNLSYTSTHTLETRIYFVDGISVNNGFYVANDVVEFYLNGALIYTGPSTYEVYYQGETYTRNPAGAAATAKQAVNSLLFWTPYLFDNITTLGNGLYFSRVVVTNPPPRA